MRVVPTIGMLLGLASVSASGLAAIIPANASEPVRRTLVGCVTNGEFITSDGYSIRPRHADGREFDLRRFEGRKIRIVGDLLPGDVLIVKRLPRDTGPCKTK